jgi:hypothetical protein
VAGSYGYGNEPSGYIKGDEYLEWQSDYYFLEKGSAPLS